MNIKEVKNVIKGSIFNADLQKQAMDFIDAQALKIEEHESTIRGQEIIINGASERVAELETALKVTENELNETNVGLFSFALQEVRKALHGDTS